MPAEDGYINEQSSESVATRIGYPPALAKACSDPFSYALGLHTGEIWRFEEAIVIDSDWVHIVLHEDADEQDQQAPLAFRRGVDLKLSAIAWVADCPEGS